MSSWRKPGAGRPWPPWRRVWPALATVAALCSLGGPAALALAAGGSQATGGGTSDGSGTRSWSAPLTLARCALAAPPQVAFPSESPATPTGPGAIVWGSQSSSCAPAAGPRGGWTVSVAALGPGDAATLEGTAPAAWSSPVGLTAVGAPFGRVALIVADAAGAQAGNPSALLQGGAADPARWPSVSVESAAAPAIARAYLGDVAIASVGAGPAIAVSVERYYDGDLQQRGIVPIHAGPVTALTAAMDYRSDVLVAWQQDGAIYARMLRASGREDPTQRVGPSAPHPQLRAVVSDNDHGMIAWSSTELGGNSAPRTHVYLDLSAAGVRFGRPLRLASFADPLRVGESPGSLQLQRLSTENVMLAWTVAEGGSYTVHAAPAVFAASRATRLSEAGSSAVLDDLAPGPAGEAIAVWSTAPATAGGTLDTSRTELWAARTSIRPHAHVVLRTPERIAPAGPIFAPAVAVDPASDQAVATWLVASSPERVEYAVSAGLAGYRPRPTIALVGPPAARTHWLPITLAAAGLVVAATAIVAVARSRRRRRRRGAF